MLGSADSWLATSAKHLTANCIDNFSPSTHMADCIRHPLVNRKTPPHPIQTRSARRAKLQEHVNFQGVVRRAERQMLHKAKVTTATD